jgi:hypothetical protein
MIFISLPPFQLRRTKRQAEQSVLNQMAILSHPVPMAQSLQRDGILRAAAN